MFASSHASRVQVDDDEETAEALEEVGRGSIEEGWGSLSPPGDESASRKRGASGSTMA